MHNATVIYTAIFGDYDALQEPAVRPAGCDFVCLTDRPQKSSAWEMRVIEPPVPGDLARSNRHCKILAHEYFPEYEYSVYIDGNMLVRGDVNELIGQYLDDVNMAAYDHNQNTFGARDCLYTEGEHLIRRCEKYGRCKEDTSIIRRQLSRYQAEGYPAHHGLITGMVLVRRHNARDVQDAMCAWWREVVNESRRDQLSFNYVAWKSKFAFSYIPGDSRDNSYFLRMYHKKHAPSFFEAVSRGIKQRIKTLYDTAE